jgi:hypothetical protein
MPRSLGLRRLLSLAPLAFAASLAGCQDKAMQARADSLSVILASVNAERDSLAGIVQSSTSEKDRALQQVIEATKFADQVDAELRQVRGLTSRVTVTSADESGRAQAANAQKDILDRLAQLRQRLAARQTQVRLLLDTLRIMRVDSTAAATLLSDLNARLATREREIAAVQQEVRLLRTENAQLVTEKTVLSDTVRAMDVRENQVYYVIGPRRQLLSDQLVTEEGGSRGLLIVKLGKTLVPARALDQTKFTAVDRREVLTIPLPNADRAYQIVSRHDVALVEVARKERDGSFRGDALRITDPAAFWAPSRYLIIAEK